MQLINDVLDLSRIESGKTELSISKIRLKEFVTGVSGAIMPLVEEKGLSLHIDVDDAVFMYGDADKLRQILVNLIGNAAKFTDKGEIGIWGGVEKGSLNDHVIIKVRDTGIGIPQEALEHIFDPFRQVDGSSTREHEGTGLGLNICHKLLNLMNGKIAVASEPGKGSTFTLTLKKDRRSKLRPTEEKWQQEIRALLLQKTEVKEKKPHVAEEGAKSILIIDDDPIVVRELKILFKEEHCELAFALTGAEGLERIRSEAPDLVLLDLRMPEMNGFEVLEELQESHDLKDLPVMIITAADLTEAEKRGLSKNVKGVITKGRIDKSALVAGVHEILYGDREIERINPTHGGRDEGRRERVVETVKKRAETGALPKVLIAEDRPDNMVFIRETLSSTGCKVCTATNGQEAVDMAKKERPDLILMDMQMPVMSGFEATKHIRGIENLKAVPIIALTAMAMKGDEEKILAAGCSDYLSKPVMPKDLVGKVEEWLGK